MSNVLRIAAIVLSLFAIGVAGVSAQDSKLAKEGLPELHVVVTDDGMQAPTDAKAGPTYVTLDNQSSDEVDVQFVVLPEGTTLDQIQAQSDNSTGFGDWFYDTTFAGGPYAAAGQQATAVVNLTEGDWYIVNSQALDTEMPASLKVSGGKDAAKSGDVKSDVKINFKDNKLDFPDEVTAGDQVWEVKNEDDTPHFIYLVWSPTEVSTDDVLMVMGLGTATPTMDDYTKLAGIVPVGSFILLSKDQIFWNELNLNPGYYVALDIVSEKGSDTPLASSGGVDAFHVPGDIVTPTPGS
jgi:hypothetical protein